MLDGMITKALGNVAADLDSRLEQIANQGKVTNALLAMLILEPRFDHNAADTDTLIKIIQDTFPAMSSAATGGTLTSHYESVSQEAKHLLDDAWGDETKTRG